MVVRDHSSEYGECFSQACYVNTWYQSYCVGCIIGPTIGVASTIADTQCSQLYICLDLSLKTKNIRLFGIVSWCHRQTLYIGESAKCAIKVFKCYLTCNLQC